MKYNNIGNARTLNEFVNSKVAAFSKLKKDFSSIYEMMFQDKKNIIFEELNGYHIKKTTYEECSQHILKRSYSLKKIIDAPKNSVIGMYLDNGVEWIEVFWAILMAGYCPLLLNMRLSLEELNKTLTKTKALGVISKDLEFNVKTIKLEELALTDNEITNPIFGDELYVMSSGSSLNVKICAYTADEFYYLINDSLRIIKDCKLIKKHTDGELKLLTFLPFYHIFGLVAVYLLFAFFSRTFVKLNDMMPQTIVNTIRRHKVTHIFAVPLFFEKTYETAIKEIKNRGDKTYKKFQKGLKISKFLGNSLLGKLFSKLAFKEIREQMFGDSINFMITGGSMISPQVLEFFNAVGYHLANGYGMSEIGITSVELSMKRKYLIDSSIGLPLKGIEYHIDDNGELLVKGKSLAKYIIEGDEIKYKSDDYFNTHDLATFKNNRYYILGRSDDLVVPATGENINPNLIEPKLLIDGVDAVSLINSKIGPVLLASVSTNISIDKASFLKEELKKKLTELNLISEIKGIEFIKGSLMEDNDFKINRKRLEKRFNEGSLRFIKNNVNISTDDELINKIRETIGITLNKDIDDISIDSDFFSDLGGNSLDYLELTTVLSKEYNVTFPNNFTNLTTPSEIANYLRDKI